MKTLTSSKKCNLCILGAGFAGLAAAYFTREAFPEAMITVFDPLPIGRGTSGIAAGLLHPFTGAHARLAPDGRQGMAATLSLIKTVEAASGESLCWKRGIFRPAHTQEQKKDFFATSQQHEDVAWWDEEVVHAQGSSLKRVPGLWIPEGYVVDCRRYLEELARLCQQRGVLFRQERIEKPDDLVDFCLVIGAMGGETPKFPPFSHLPLRRTKGQLLLWNLTEEVSLPFPINGQGYVLQHPREDFFIVGATFEREFRHTDPDLTATLATLGPKIEPLLPELFVREPAICRAGVRLSTPHHRPLAQHIQGKYWILSAFGAKGILYHALFAQKLIADCKKSLG